MQTVPVSEITAALAIDHSARGFAAQIVAAYVSNNPVSPDRLPALFTDVYRGIIGSTPADQPPAQLPTPAVPVKKSITPDAIICLEDGRAFRSLKRHLRTTYSMSPEEYRAKWGLPADYPMVAPNYSARRSELAKEHGLGKKR